MNKVILITTRDYPFRNDILSTFEMVDIDVYNECIRSLRVLSDEDRNALKDKVNKKNTLEDLIKRRTIGNLFKEEGADDGTEWTRNSQPNNGRTFIDFKKEGIPLLKRTIHSTQLEDGVPILSVTFYVLPCTGTLYIGNEDQDSLLRQEYTSNCINLICSCEKIKRKDIYAIIHSRDTGITGSDMQSRVIKSGEQKPGAPLEDISNAGHLYLFHHTVGHPIYDKIIAPLCGVNENKCSIEELFAEEGFFPADVIGWWDKLSKLNDAEFVY